MAHFTKLVLSVALTAVVLVGGAKAAHADRELTEWSPSTLEPHEFRVGFGVVGMGLWGSKLLDRIEIDTIPLIYTLNATGVRSYDVTAKFEFWREDNLSMSVTSGVTGVNLAPLLGLDDKQQLHFRIIPVEGWAAYRICDCLRVTGGVVYTNVAVLGQTQAGPIDDLEGAIGSSTVQAYASVQYRMSPRWYVIGGARLLLYQRQFADVTAGTGGTGGTAGATTDAIDPANAWAGSVAFHYAGPHFNLRLGLEYGNYQVPIVNFVADRRGFAPMFSMYWRIGNSGPN